MYGIMSRTEFQHLAGPRTELDFVETPSTLMEYFASDYRVLKMFARHHITNEVIPKSMVEAMWKSKLSFSATDTLTQVSQGLLDLNLFGTQPLPDGSTTALWQRLTNNYTLVPYESETYWHSKFGHLCHYGAGYYSYLYCRVFSSCLWYKCFASDPLNREQGLKYRHEFLAVGGAKSPLDLLRNMLGSDPSIDVFIDEQRQAFV